MDNEFGIVEMRIRTVLHKDTGERVTLPAVAPKAKAAPLARMESKVDKSLYIYHEDTVTVFAATEKGYGNRFIWQLECRADNGDLVRVEAWAEHDRMIQAEGYAPLPPRYTGRAEMKIDAIIKYDTVYHAYRISYIFPRAVEPTLTVVGKPVRHVIPITVETETARTGLRLALRRKLATRRPVKPLVDITHDKTGKLPVIAGTATGEHESEAA
jgi:hypothetical protein